MTAVYQVLLIEDEIKKSEELKAQFLKATTIIKERTSTPGEIDFKVTHAKTIIAAEDEIEGRSWDLVLLDITLNISEAGVVNFDGNREDLAGLEIAETMFLTEQVFPTIIVTGFDYFKLKEAKDSSTHYLYLDELSKQANRYLGDDLVSTIRYGSDGWKEDFSSAIHSWFQKITSVN